MENAKQGEKPKDLPSTMLTLSDYFGEPQLSRNHFLNIANEQDSGFLEDLPQDRDWLDHLAHGICPQNLQENPPSDNPNDSEEGPQEGMSEIKAEISNLLLGVVNIRSKTKKGTNVPKYLVRLLRDNYKVYLKFFSQTELRQLFVWINSVSGKGQNNFNVATLLKAVGHDIAESQMRTKTRAMLRRILRTMLKDHVIKNYNIKSKKNKLSYLNSLKIYALRCRNSTLTSRIQSR